MSGHTPLKDATYGDGLWPKIPLKNAGARIEPAKSEPMPKAEPAAA